MSAKQSPQEFSFFRGLSEPLDLLFRIFILLGSSGLVQCQGFCQILLNTSGVLIAPGKMILSARGTLFCRGSIPFGRLHPILGNSPAAFIHMPEVALTGGVTPLCGAAIQFYRFLQVLLDAFSPLIAYAPTAAFISRSVPRP